MKKKNKIDQNQSIQDLNQVVNIFIQQEIKKMKILCYLKFMKIKIIMIKQMKSNFIFKYKINKILLRNINYLWLIDIWIFFNKILKIPYFLIKSDNENHNLNKSDEVEKV